MQPFPALGRKTLVLCSILITVLFFGFAPLLMPLNFGLSNAEAMSPYLNGVFTANQPTGPDSVTYTIENAFPNLVFLDPVKLLELPNGQLIVLGKSGDVWVFNNDPAVNTKTQILDITPQVRIAGDGGMLGLALHPEFGVSGSPNEFYLYIWYRYKPVGSSQGQNAYMRLSRFTINSSYTNIDPNSEFVMIQQYDRHDWHNGGDMFFGMDGFLYIAIGDEGGANDQFNRTQSISDWLFGGVLRIDVDMQGGTVSHPIRRQPQNGASPPSGFPNSFTQGYYIPSDNPWLDPNGGILEEFWAIGTRSPHRMTLDTVTGNIWLGDIGQGTMEEISLVAQSANLQWPYKEGTVNGPKAKPNPLIGYDQTPVYAYPRTVGRCVIGGHVIRGNKYPELEGRYIFGDHEMQDVWTLELGPMGNGQNVEFLLNVPAEGSGSKDGISSFASISDGTVFILDLFGTNQNGGKIHKLKRIPHGGVPDPPALLSQTGAFTDLVSLTPAAGLIPYTVNSPLWSDGSTKKRWIAIPNDGAFDSASEQVVFDPDDFWSFPAGTVMIKHFELPLDANNPSSTARLETRFFIHNGSNTPYGITYRWNPGGTEAYLTEGEEIGDWQVTDATGAQVTQTWTFPSRQQCMDCHNPTAGFALGLKAHQLNGDLTYASGITSNQLETWQHLNIFTQPIPPVDQLRKAYGLGEITATAEDRIMSYLDANCAHCHRNGQVDAAFDARYHLLIENKNIVGTLASGMNTPMGQHIVQFGDTSNSELWIRDRMEAGETGIMPPLARSLVDNEYIDLLTEWIMRTNDYQPSTNRTPLNIRVYLEGAMDGDSMEDALRMLAYVPNDEPYANIFGHVGQGGGEWVSNTTLDHTDSVSVVDWIMVELRHDVMPEIVEQTYSALLLSDGRIIDPQGGPLMIGTANESYHVAIRHRNHLGIMTAQAVIFDGSDVELDFTDPALNTYGIDAQRSIAGVRMMWTGDANSSGVIKYTGIDNDRDAVLFELGGSSPTTVTSGYKTEDVNLDGFVKYTGVENDRDAILLNLGGNVPTNIRVEQLP